MPADKIYQQIMNLQKLLTPYFDLDEDLPETIDDVWLEGLIKELEILFKNL